MNPESLEHRIETAWLALCSRGPQARPVTLYLTQTDVITGWTGDVPPWSFEIGTYNRGVTLVAFREDVFFAYENARRANA